ncbi:MAG: hypothetical protein ABGW91_10755 [Christiangramia sp.]|uniref:Uncharacterized protein n=1 Tax=Christiangramia flava JLT2011 TaxID=1229726 RepID=A0A1L7I8S9_9FLAO|nr:hypothetical protein [Christiangramia flava]APU69515.1 hypothetical protein GRFL_2791 [Christiangramia flava JLT2011]MAM19072.1 hypothetical protein [Christiangramia sp.]OSS37882.1 hypothetical protein C723_3161 [Christiangramia flava JLT2011]
MGGEGSMSQANQSLKLNRSMLRRKSFRDRKDLMRSFAGTTVVDFEELSPEEMLMIKEEIRAKARKERKKLIIVYLFSVVLTIIIIAWIFQYA